jgi:hypothetical protein
MNEPTPDNYEEILAALEVLAASLMAKAAPLRLGVAQSPAGHHL